MLAACLAEESRLRLDVPEQKREELFFLVAKVDTLFVPEELHEFSGRREPSRSISVRGSTAQPQCLHESIVMVARERDQGGVALHSTTLRYSVVPAVLGELTRPRHDCVLAHCRLIRADHEVQKARLAFAVRTLPGLSPASQTASGDRPPRRRRRSTGFARCAASIASEVSADGS